MNIIEQIALKFTSGNSVPVDRATITADEFERFRHWVSCKEMEYDIAEEARLRDNSYLIARAEKAEADRDIYRVLFQETVATAERLQEQVLEFAQYVSSRNT